MSNPEYRQKLLKGETFGFTEREKAEKMEEGMNQEDIREKEEGVIKRQRLARQETVTKKELESGAEPTGGSKKMSFEEFKAQQEKGFEDALKAARQKKEEAYREKE